MVSKRGRTATTVILTALVILLLISTVSFALSRVGVTVPYRQFKVRTDARHKVVLVTTPGFGPFITVRYQVRTKYGLVWLFGQWRTKVFYYSGQGTGLRHVARGVYVRCWPRSCRYGEMAVYK